MKVHKHMVTLMINWGIDFLSKQIFINCVWIVANLRYICSAWPFYSIQVVPKIQQTTIIINGITKFDNYHNKILIFLFTLTGLGIVVDYDSESFSKNILRKSVCNHDPPEIISINCVCILIKIRRQQFRCEGSKMIDSKIIKGLFFLSAKFNSMCMVNFWSRTMKKKTGNNNKSRGSKNDVEF